MPSKYLRSYPQTKATLSLNYRSLSLQRTTVPCRVRRLLKEWRICGSWVLSSELNIYTTTSQAQGTSQKKGQKERKTQKTWRGLGNAVSGHDTAVEILNSKQWQSPDLDLSKTGPDREQGARGALSLPVELLAIDTFWKMGSQGLLLYTHWGARQAPKDCSKLMVIQMAPVKLNGSQKAGMWERDL